ncbi:hypothetical protein AS132_00430 [Photobacterium sanguinicancri]|nr:hypothetical protein AS132_00430 [Photobacterium sanguinicancri]
MLSIELPSIMSRNEKWKNNLTHYFIWRLITLQSKSCRMHSDAFLLLTEDRDNKKQGSVKLRNSKRNNFSANMFDINQT